MQTLTLGGVVRVPVASISYVFSIIELIISRAVCGRWVPSASRMSPCHSGHPGRGGQASVPRWMHPMSVQQKAKQQQQQQPSTRRQAVAAVRRRRWQPSLLPQSRARQRQALPVAEQQFKKHRMAPLRRHSSWQHTARRRRRASTLSVSGLSAGGCWHGGSAFGMHGIRACLVTSSCSLLLQTWTTRPTCSCMHVSACVLPLASIVRPCLAGKSAIEPFSCPIRPD